MIGFYEERSAGNAVKALMDSLAPKAKVRSAGQWSEIGRYNFPIISFFPLHFLVFCSFSSFFSIGCFLQFDLSLFSSPVSLFLSSFIKNFITTFSIIQGIVWP
jgi:hypothetical protein